MWQIRRQTRGFLFSWIAFTCSLAAHADPAECPEATRGRASDFKRKGDEAVHALRYAEAIEAYDESYEACPDAAVLYNRGRAHEARGEFVEACEDLKDFRARAPEALRARVPDLNEFIAEVCAKVGTLVIECKVPDTKVWINGEAIGKCPPRISLPRSEGSINQIEAEAPGYARYRHRVEIEGGESSSVTIQLELLLTTGRLQIGGPGDAKIFVDQQRVGRPPVELIVKPGRHEVLGRRRGHRKEDQSVVVDAGETRVMHLELDDAKPFTARWWFWTAIGAGVGVAAGVTAAALIIEKPPDDGKNFSPGRVSGPLVVILP